MKRVLSLIGLASLTGCASGVSSTGATVTDYIPFTIGLAGVLVVLYAGKLYLAAKKMAAGTDAQKGAFNSAKFIAIAGAGIIIGARLFHMAV